MALKRKSLTTSKVGEQVGKLGSPTMIKGVSITARDAGDAVRQDRLRFKVADSLTHL